METSLSRPRAAVVGIGFIGALHAEALARLGVPVVAVVDPSRPATASFEEVLADDRVDVVHVATPNYLHYAQAKAALLAGKHVVCEKPLTLAAQEAAELAELAAETGLVNAVGFVFRSYAQARELRALCSSGALGEVRNVHGSYLQDWLLLPTDWNWRLDPALGGGLRAVADIGSHWLDLAQYVTGLRVEAVCAELATTVPVRLRPASEVRTFASADATDRVEVAITTEDAAFLLLRFEGGARGAATISQVSAGRKNALSLEVDGSSAAAAWVSERPEELWIGHRGRANELLLRDPSLLSPEARPYATLPGGHAEGFREALCELYRPVYAAAAQGRQPDRPDFPTFEDGRRAVALGEAIARSAREGVWVETRQAVHG
ncbi:MAG TPA: Gfo/Idh/MocA family oxidoreductase [Gaiellaceae bacterium]|nr:Gfo/Idh/MocA family oxidoreductase [Gaiellaceae bacterium]